MRLKLFIAHYDQAPISLDEMALLIQDQLSLFIKHDYMREAVTGEPINQEEIELASNLIAAAEVYSRASQQLATVLLQAGIQLG